MNKAFYARLAVTNIKKNSKTHLPYILTCIGVIAMVYMMSSLSQNPGVGVGSVSMVLKLALWVTAIFAIVFLFYTNSFLMKRRKKEFGLYSILGMEKRHLGLVMLFETFFIALISIIGGLAVGMLLDKVMYLLLLGILNFEVSLGFRIAAIPIIGTVVLFCGIFFLIFLNGLRQVYRANPIELLKGGNVGEREPKTKWVLAIIGALCLGGGYFIAVTTTSPLAAMFGFFVAVLLVMAGTYLLFTAGSIAFLKALRKNKSYYYKTKNFISVSGMMYRMKQNAIGLANICILSTAVLVMISTTLSMYIGMEDILKTRYPREFVFDTSDFGAENMNELHKLASETTKAKNLTPINEVEYKYFAFTAVQSENFLDTSPSDNSVFSLDNAVNAVFIPLSDYNKMTGKSSILEDREVIVCSNRLDYTAPDVKVLDMEFTVKEKVENFMENGMVASNIASTHFFIVKNMDVIDTIREKMLEVDAIAGSPPRYYYGFDLDATDAEIMAVYDDMWNKLEEEVHFEGRMECRSDEKGEFMSLYGGLFFIGIFLGVLFIMATILIIYYKQVSEGYDDRGRFEIMQKVGMSKNEIKKSIHSQVLTVFFLPLVTAAVHIAFAFPVITKLLALLNLTNIPLFAICTVGCLGVFALLYALVYSATARVYYKIVS